MGWGVVEGGYGKGYGIRVLDGGCVLCGLFYLFKAGAGVDIWMAAFPLHGDEGWVNIQGEWDGRP